MLEHIRRVGIIFYKREEINDPEPASGGDVRCAWQVLPTSARGILTRPQVGEFQVAIRVMGDPHHSIFHSLLKNKADNSVLQDLL